MCNLSCEQYGARIRVAIVFSWQRFFFRMRTTAYAPVEVLHEYASTAILIDYIRLLSWNVTLRCVLLCRRLQKPENVRTSIGNSGRVQARLTCYALRAGNQAFNAIFTPQHLKVYKWDNRRKSFPKTSHPLNKFTSEPFEVETILPFHRKQGTDISPSPYKSYKLTKMGVYKGSCD